MNQSQKIMVSVIVMTYNHECYIQKALESILMQKVDFKYEILIGDDCSSDNTYAVANTFKEKFSDLVYLHRNIKNLGPTRNGYSLLKKTKGLYIATCEGDDYWTDPYKLQIQFDFLQNNMSFSACAHDVTIVDENGNKKKSDAKLDCKKKTFYPKRL